MIIGVDAGTLSVSDERLKVGVYHVVYNALRVLGQIDRKNQYVLYSFDPIDKAIMNPFGPRMHNKVLRPKKGWFTVRLPLEMRMHPVDVFLGLSQAVPRTSSRSVGFIYDVGFLHHPEAYPDSYHKLKHQTEDLVDRSVHIMAISETVKNDILNFYRIPSERISVAYPGCDHRFIAKGKEYIGRHPYFLFVGALKRGKNVPTLVNAFAQLARKSKKKFDLYLVGGDYWKDPAIDQSIGLNNLAGCVKKFGHVADSELPAMYRGATAFVSPSLHEGFCIPAVEAMACGCPVIGSSQGAMKEIVGDAGLIVSPNNVDELVSAMERMNDEKTRKSFRRKGIIRANKYSWELFGKNLYNCIHELDNTTS